MPIKIFAAPGDHRDDFEQIEQQANEWMEESGARVVSMQTTVSLMPTARDVGSFMMTLLVHYERGGT